MITVERLDPLDEDGFRELCEFLIPMAGEVSVVPVDPVKATEEGWKAVSEGNTFICKIDGRMAGALALVQNRYWQNPALTFLIDQFFYVAQDMRFGLVGVKLLRAAREEALPHEDAIFVRVMNRSRRQKQVEDAFYATMVGYLPFGHMTTLRQRKVLAEAAQ